MWRIPLNGAALVGDPQPFLVGLLGRLRSLLAVDDHTLLVTTSNGDGRTTPRSGDDRLVLLTVTEPMNPAAHTHAGFDGAKVVLPQWFCSTQRVRDG